MHSYKSSVLPLKTNVEFLFRPVSGVLGARTCGGRGGESLQVRAVKCMGPNP